MQKTRTMDRVPFSLLSLRPQLKLVMPEDISPELKEEFERFLEQRKSGTGWHAKLALYASTLKAHEIEYRVKLCDDNDASIATALNTIA